MKLLKKYHYVLWMGGIFVCLLFLLVGLIFGIASHRYGDRDTLSPQLGASAKADTAEAQVTMQPGTPVQVSDGTLRELTEGKDAGQEYLSSVTFLTDSRLAALKNGGIVSSGNLWLGENGTVSAASLGSCSIVFPADGSVVSAINAAMISKPSTLLVSLGHDGLADVQQSEFITSYESLIRGIQSSSPETVIVCCSLIPVTGDSTVQGLSNGGVIGANEWIKTVCADTGVYFLDLGKAVSSSGVLNADYAESDGCALNSAGIGKILDYIRTHAAK